MVAVIPLLERSILSLTIIVQEQQVQQSALDSLAKVVLQNRRTLNVITPEARVVYALLNEMCCFYVNTSSQVEENLLVLKKKIKLIEDLRERAGQGPSWLSTLISSMETQVWTWLLPLLGPFVLIAFVLLLGPCIINLLV